MAMALTTEERDPVMDINTTPLIDVMLVLLIMFIITIPIQTHAVKLDLPGAQNPLLPHPINGLKNRLVVSEAGRIFWNGQQIDMVRLRQYLALSENMQPAPELQLEPDAQAPYAVVDQVMAATKRAQVERMGFVGNEKYVSAF